MFATRPYRLAVLASGDGSSCEPLALASQRGESRGQVALLLSDSPDSQEVDTRSLAGFMRRLHEAGHRLHRRAVRRFPGGPWRRKGRRLVLAGCQGEVARG